MPLKQEGDTPRRRRGPALERSLLDAAWQELVERGYDAFTIERVAERAGTSRAVLYRRWPTKPQLVRDAVVHGLQVRDREVPDTGTVRGDLIELMRHSNATRMPLATVVSVQLGPYFTETESSLSDLREAVLGGSPSLSEVVFQRAVERGELDPARLTARVRRLPFDLLRHEVLMTLRPVPDEVICEIVDTVFLPLVRPAEVRKA